MCVCVALCGVLAGASCQQYTRAHNFGHRCVGGGLLFIWVGDCGPLQSYVHCGYDEWTNVEVKEQG